VLAAASGLAFGAMGGAALSLAGAVLGGVATFALARTVARRQVEAALLRQPRFERVLGLRERRGFLATLTARLMPGTRATGLHYAAGVSPVKARGDRRRDHGRRPAADDTLCAARSGHRLRLRRRDRDRRGIDRARRACRGPARTPAPRAGSRVTVGSASEAW
jgi:hypothetical protein